MDNPWLHRYTNLVAVCTALLFITGPVVSTNENRPLYSLGECHAWLGAAVTILMAGLVLWLSRAKERILLQRLAWAALAANIALDLVALEPDSLPAPVRFAHTLLGQLFFSSTVAMAVFTSPFWNQIPKPVDFDNAPRLRFLATTTATLVLLQITLGAAFRHGVMGALPHILGALTVAVFLGPAMAAILRTETTDARSAAIALIMLTTVQLLLGFGLLTMQSFDEIDPLVVIIATIAHVAIGAFTLAAAVVMALWIRRATAKPA
jgi:heme A synthase